MSSRRRATEEFVGPRAVARIHIRDESGSERVVAWSGKKMLIGRDPRAQLRLARGYVSRTHARLFLRDGVIYVEDLRSRNGLRVNGMPAQGTTALNLLDCVQIGNYVLWVAPPAEDELAAITEQIRPPRLMAAVA